MVWVDVTDRYIEYRFSHDYTKLLYNVILLHAELLFTIDFIV